MKGRKWLYPLLLAAAIVGMFHDSLRIGFLWDDYCFLDASDTFPEVVKSFYGDWFGHDFRFPAATYYRPFQIAMTYAELRVWGERAWGYHIDLLLIHYLSSLLLVPLIRLLLPAGKREGSEWVCWFAALLFALHPRHGESLYMVNGRTDSLCALFYLLSVVTYLQWRVEGSKRGYWLSCLAFICALLSKEMAISLPFLLLLYELTLHRQQDRAFSWLKSLKNTSVHFILLVLVFGLLRSWAMRWSMLGEARFINPFASFHLHLYSSCKLLIAVFLPFDTILWSAQNYVLAFKWLFGLSAILLVLILLCYSIWKGQMLVSMACGFIISSFPVLTEISNFQTTISDRYLYTPSIALPLITASMLAWKTKLLRYGGIVMCTVWVIFVIPQNRLYSKQWQVADETARSIITQFEELDKVRPKNERFRFVALPGIYEGKSILNTAFNRYINNKSVQNRKPSRLEPPYFLADMQTSFDHYSVKGDWLGNAFQCGVDGGRFLFPYQSLDGVMQLQSGSSFPATEAAFDSNPFRNFPLLLLGFENGEITFQNIPCEKTYVIEGTGGNSRAERFVLTKELGIREALFDAIPKIIRVDLPIPETQGVHCSVGKIDSLHSESMVFSFSHNPAAPTLVWVTDLKGTGFIGHPFSPFKPDSYLKPSSEVYTAAGRFVPGIDTPQIACSQGLGGNQLVRIFEYTGEPAPTGFKLIAQLQAFEKREWALNRGGAVTLAAADFDGDGIDELVMGQGMNSSHNPLIRLVKMAEPDNNGFIAPEYFSPSISAFPPSLEIGGVIPAIGDIDGDGKPEIIGAPMNMDENGTTFPTPATIQIFNTESNGGNIVLTKTSNQPIDIPLLEYDSMKSIRVSCGNFDLDPMDEMAVGVATPVNGFVQYFEIQEGGDQGISVMQMYDGNQHYSPNWEHQNAQWLETVVIQQ